MTAMAYSGEENVFVTLLPGLRADDAYANFWLRQVTLRLRREVCWCWHERAGTDGNGLGALPPFTDSTATALDMTRFWSEKQAFFRNDVTARYLSTQLEPAPSDSGKKATRGSFGWVVQTLELNDVSSFVLALALAAALDASLGSVIATCLNNPGARHANLALAQKLWDQPEEVLGVAAPLHPLFRYGLVSFPIHETHHSPALDWESPLIVPALVANQLLFPKTPLPQGLELIPRNDADSELSQSARLALLRLKCSTGDKLQIVPVMGPGGSPRAEAAQRIGWENNKDCLRFNAAGEYLDDGYLNSILTLCWLRDNYLFLSLPSGGKQQPPPSFPRLSPSIPATVFVAAGDPGDLAGFPRELLLPAVSVPSLSYQQRIAHWKNGLGPKARGLDDIIAECSRRFRFEKETATAVCAELKQIRGRIKEADFVAACRAELDMQIGDLATRVLPRFEREELILPRKQSLQFQEHIKAMRSLTEVHYGWGTARVWNESGISALFAGPPGTGKTMAAEILAIRLDLPMYRIDLSQVVNKYIGETEKNLKRIFDAADVSDMILFFDEADSLFGKRTEVSDAHDRYANLEISYLLERMERFKGLAILATNRKKDLDEAFLRRLRYVIDFPLPGVEERERIWRQMIPDNADSSELDFHFLAKQFQFAGGHIRSVVFNACLNSADGATLSGKGVRGRLTMEKVIIAVKRECDKLNRPLGLEQFGPYARIVEGLEYEQK